MKKVYKLLAAAIVALAPMAPMAQAATQPVALWGKSVSAPQKTGMGYDLAVASDGALYSLTSAGTMTDLLGRRLAGSDQRRRRDDGGEVPPQRRPHREARIC